jgi:hypothetical protein
VSVYNSEGTQAAATGMGRGPYYLLNNFSSGAGNIWHMDDQNLSTSATAYNTVPAGYLWQRNTFNMPLSTIPGHPASDGYQYGHRETIEWKSGTQIKIDGNIFQGGQTDVSPYGCSGLWSNNSAFTITDVEVSYNSFRNTPCASAFISVPHPGQKGPPLNRIYLHDNVTENQDAYTFTSWATNPNHTGIWTTHGYLVEDMIVDHNTIVDARGTSPDMFHLIGTPQEGTQITNNIFWGNDDAGHHGWISESTQANTPNCGGLVAKSGMDCLFVQGAGNTLYSYLQNVLVPQFLNSKNLTGDAGVAAWLAAYAGLPGAIVQTGSSPQARAAAVGFTSFAYGGTGATGNDYHLTSTSPYCSGCGSPATDRGDIGANVEALAVAQGSVSQPNITVIAATTVSISFVAPDAFGCAVDWSTDGFSTFHRVANAGGSRLQNVTLGADGTPLTTKTPYSYRVLCAVNQPQGSFTTK